jgi:hypothetical protein
LGGLLKVCKYLLGAVVVEKGVIADFEYPGVEFCGAIEAVAG